MSLTIIPYDGDSIFGFTGEQTDSSELIYLRSHYYNPALGAFMSLDPFEGVSDRAMSLNGYSWVEWDTAERPCTTGGPQGFGNRSIE
jgi:RHS repeat-associated protein